jgi:hypothetical protein
VNATRSWNLAVVTLGISLAVFLASVAATAYGWHAVATVRAGGVSALAMAACGFWLHRAAGRFWSHVGQRGEDEDEGPAGPCPYPICHHNLPEAGERPAS